MGDTTPKRWILTSYPEREPSPANFRLETFELPPLADGEVHVRNRWMSVDPYMRLRLNPASGFWPAPLGEPMEGPAVGEVVASRSDAFKLGDSVWHLLGWRTDTLAPAAALGGAVDVGDESIRHWLNLLGPTGMTAYYGLLEIAAPKRGETMFVTSAAGAVGAAVVQIGKILGLRIIASAGGAEKCAFLTRIGADATIDHRTPGTMEEKLRALAPDGIDICFDNVGGDHLDAALGVARRGARIVCNGFSASYNDAAMPPLANLMRVSMAEIRMQGFLVESFFDRPEPFRGDMLRWLAEGRITSHDTIFLGIEHSAAAFSGMFAGGPNIGKIIIAI